MNISRPRLRLPSPALIISCVALFSALGGGAYAATSLSSSSPTWHNATYLHGWTTYGGTYAPAGYAKDSNGVVHLRGGVSGGSAEEVFQLPVGYRPTHYIYTTIYTVSGSQGSVEITPTGDVLAFGTGATGYSGLDGVSFAAGE
jgi:hypothetical protein